MTSPWPGEDALGTAIVTSSPLAVIVLDEHRTVRSFNRAAERLTGRAAAEVVGDHARLLFPPATQDATLDRIEAAAGDGLGAHLELTMRTTGAGEVPVGMSWGPLRHAGRTIGLVGVGRDITRRKDLEHELAQMANGLRELGEATDLGMYRFTLRPRMHVEYLNPALENRLGYTVEELRADPSPLWRRLPSVTVDRLAALRRGQEQAGNPIETSWTHPDGSTILIEIREVHLRDADGKVTSALGLVTDVTMQRLQQETLAETLRLERQATDELRRVDDLRRLFLQAVSHELRTPLTTVLGFASTLRRSYDRIDRTAAIGMAERIHQQGERLLRLLDDLLDVERLSRGVVALDRRPVDLADVVRTVVGEHGDEHVRVEAEPTPVQMDPVKVERILVNLLSNARRHAGPDAAVQVRIEPADPFVRIVVDDDGPGLADELKSRVFEPFEQGPRASVSASPGTGIGLALVSAFAGLHGGSAWVEDSDLGGARFVVELRRDGEPGPEDQGRVGS